MLLAFLIKKTQTRTPNLPVKKKFQDFLLKLSKRLISPFFQSLTKFHNTPFLWWKFNEFLEQLKQLIRHFNEFYKYIDAVYLIFIKFLKWSCFEYPRSLFRSWCSKISFYFIFWFLSLADKSSFSSRKTTKISIKSIKIGKLLARLFLRLLKENSTYFRK